MPGATVPPPTLPGRRRSSRPGSSSGRGTGRSTRSTGGAVEVTTAGPAAHGARVALLADYERRGLVQLFDRRLRDRLFELLSRPPRRIVPPDEIDFTPYWRRPIPPSYFPD